MTTKTSRNMGKTEEDDQTEHTILSQYDVL